jgi:hypothetical protein
MQHIYNILIPEKETSTNCSDNQLHCSEDFKLSTHTHTHINLERIYLSNFNFPHVRYKLIAKLILS